MRTTKYHNKRVDTEFGKFDSKKEYSRYLKLMDMQKAGFINNLQRQVPFELIPPQESAGRKIRAVKYIADFVYTQKGKVIIEDVKGIKTDVYKIKSKLMLWRYGVQIKEV